MQNVQHIIFKCPVMQTWVNSIQTNKPASESIFQLIFYIYVSNFFFNSIDLMDHILETKFLHFVIYINTVPENFVLREFRRNNNCQTKAIA